MVFVFIQSKNVWFHATKVDPFQVLRLNPVNVTYPEDVVTSSEKVIPSGTISGRLEVRDGSTWYSICDDGWTMRNTDVACGELGLGRAVTHYSKYDTLSDLDAIDMLLNDVSCVGNENTIFACLGGLGLDPPVCETHETVGITCSGPINTLFCVSSNGCPFGLYANSTSRQCERCFDGCADCWGDYIRCTACNSSSYLSNDGRCVPKCPTGEYGHIHERKCIRCDVMCATCRDGSSGEKCLSCDVYSALHAGRCLSTCPDGYSMYNTSTVSACVSVCPAGHTGKNGTCLKCDESCETCDVTINCTSCDHGGVLQYLAVNETDYADSSVILSASDDSVIGICQSTCKTGHYANSQGICEICEHISCEVCTRGGTYCTRCVENTVLYLGQCVTSCPPDLYGVDGTCTTECPDGYYGIDDDCRSCPGLCRRCLKGDTIKCSACYQGYFLKDNVCVRECGPGYISESYLPGAAVRLTLGRDQFEGRVEAKRQGTELLIRVEFRIMIIIIKKIQNSSCKLN